MVSYYLGYSVQPKPNLGTKPWRARVSKGARASEREKRKGQRKEREEGKEIKKGVALSDLSEKLVFRLSKWQVKKKQHLASSSQCERA